MSSRFAVCARLVVLCSVVSLGLPAAVWPCAAVAQSTGGSFGGGSFSGGGGGGDYGGGGGYGGGGDYGGGYSPTYQPSSGYQGYDGGYGGTPYEGGSGDGFSALCCCFIIFVLMAAVMLLSRFRSGDAVRGTVPSTNRIDVSGLMLAIDWRARKHVQGQLERLAREGDTSTRDGLARMARETALALRRAELSWLYGSVLNALPAAPQDAERVFRRAAAEARAKFRYELIRNSDGSSRVSSAPTQRSSREEGEGVVVVTLLVAAHRELIDVADVTNANEVRHLLDQVIALDGESLAVLEVIWSPADDADRMSTAELEVLYPDLRRINEETVAGRVFCAYCAAPFAKELNTCPHCGAPAGDARPRS
ncbi:MAG: DUF1517 domain-containing protein [Sandaracinaceae bacterium]|nr:DUF1517 domain-containing protein [Sandaracinaceae bacterium]